MRGITLSDLPEPYRAQAEAQLGRQALYLAAASQLPCLDRPRPATGKIGRVPSKTEMAFREQVLDPQIRAGILRKADYESMTFRMANRHRYTPDWVAYDYQGRCSVYEVKGSYRLGSYQRARLAFDQARLEWEDIAFFWYELQKSGAWKSK